MIVLSPHLDDAIFSCGALLSICHPTVITVCAGIPDDTTGPSKFDERFRFASGADAMIARRVEDLEAVASIGGEAWHLDCLDACYAADQPIAEAVEHALAGVAKGEVVLAPLGLHHPDHEAVAAAFMPHAQRFRSLFYEELPYGVRWPEEVAPAIERRGCADEALSFSTNAAKHRAMRLYPSQLVDTDLVPYTRPERYHPC